MRNSAMSYARRLALGGGGVAALTAALLVGAPSAQASGEVCGGAPGPGTVNKVCTTVDGFGTVVRSIEVRPFATHLDPPSPAQICGARFEVFGVRGQPNEGAPYSDAFETNECGLGSLGAVFRMFTEFKDGSLLCGVSIWQGQRSAPRCVTIVA